MRILLVNDYGTPTGGAEVQFIGLREELRKRGHAVHLFTSSARPTASASAADSECFGTTSRLRTLVQSANPWAMQALHRVLVAFRPDVVHVKLFLTQLSPLILPLLRSVPSLYHVVWYRPVCPKGTKLLPNGTACQVSPGLACYREECLPLHDWLPLMLQMRLWQRWRDVFRLVVANSAATRRKLLAEGIGPVEVIWNGVTPRLVRPALPTQPTVAFAGRLVAEKGVAVLVRAFAEVATQMPHARLLLAGEGPERAALQQLAEHLGLAAQVSFLGRLPRADLEAAFAGAWVQAVPSLWEEPFGIVAAEAAMRGTAVVASDVGGLAEIVRHAQTGYLVPPANLPALAQALLRVLRDQAHAEQLGRAAHAVALAEFNETSVTDRFVACYQSIC